MKKSSNTVLLNININVILEGYVLLEDYENTYQVKFIWSQTVLLENNRKFTLGRMTCNFITDSGEFQEK
ncbi:hypothetical protein RhiirA1_456703 [Rhizophagus irregularis]|uniref:Uncharacterized protein n=1 Tax=Rhizophagus irregularis TaxID=588596 RepID=A0A2I1FPK8_9GLOM|nr:hypothetical protein RhiirA1_456703 [Rhizophagus irregularis]PKY36316.1 hypothetical protein RhiirB3_458643 [Rhizophagus irregularis]